MTDETPEDSKVGYKRPPSHSRFKAGQSGNPRGRQKGVRNLATDVKRTLATPVTLTEQGKEGRRVSTQQAALMRLKEKALKGDARALDRLLALAQTFNNDAPPEAPAGQNLDAEDQAILNAYAATVRSQDARGSSQKPADRTDDPENVDG